VARLPDAIATIERRPLPAGEAESFQLIRAHLCYFNVDRELRTLLVASAAPGHGKTTVARHLAGAAARVGSRVLLLEADLRRNRRDVAQRLHETLSGAGAPLLGVIANGFKARRNAPYSYAYDYSYKSEPPSGSGPPAGGSPSGGAATPGSSANGATASDAPVPTSQA
jgi:Mrp family chromosome partitioning ATPase